MAFNFQPLIRIKYLNIYNRHFFALLLLAISLLLLAIKSQQQKAFIKSVNYSIQPTYQMLYPFYL